MPQPYFSAHLGGPPMYALVGMASPAFPVIGALFFFVCGTQCPDTPYITKGSKMLNTFSIMFVNISAFLVNLPESVVNMSWAAWEVNLETEVTGLIITAITIIIFFYVHLYRALIWGRFCCCCPCFRQRSQQLSQPIHAPHEQEQGSSSSSDPADVDASRVITIHQPSSSSDSAPVVASAAAAFAATPPSNSNSKPCTCRSLISTGPYSLCKHPLLICSIMYTVGVTLMTGAWLFGVALAFNNAVYVTHLQNERNIMIKHYGQEFIAYEQGNTIHKTKNKENNTESKSHAPTQMQPL